MEGVLGCIEGVLARLDEVSVIKFKWWRYMEYNFSKAQWRGC